MSSLSRRITIAVVGITAVVVLVAAVGLWLVARQVLLGEVDRDLRERVERTQRFDRMGGPRRTRPPNASGDDPWLVQAFDSNGALIGASPSTPAGIDLRGGPGAVTQRLPDGRRVRAITYELSRPPPGLDPPPPPEWTLGGVRAVLALDLSGVDAELRRVGLILSGLWLAATLLAWFAAMALRRAILRPVAELTAAITRLGPSDLAARLPTATGPAEAQVLVGRLNTLLGQLEEAFRREQATISAIAHELRTPVAGLRTEIEFRLMAASDAQEQQTLHRLLETATRMQAMVGNILLLARLESGREHLDRTPTDVPVLLAVVLERWAGRCAARHLEVRVSAPETLILATSAVHLEIVLDNLIGNAASHASEGAPIGIELAGSVQGVRLTVVNACSIELDAAQLGTPFWRGDAARSDGDHSGLGLALGRRIARMLGGDLLVAAAAGRFSAMLTLTGR